MKPFGKPTTDEAIFISLCLHSITFFHAEHFKTRSYELHKTFEHFYKDMDDLVDKLAEVYMGNGGEFEYYVKDYDMTPTDMLDSIIKNADYIRQRQSSEIQTLLDEIKVLCGQTKYRMLLK